MRLLKMRTKGLLTKSVKSKSAKSAKLFKKFIGY